jgi:hypothetical protein
VASRIPTERRTQRPLGSSPFEERYRLVAFSPSVHEMVEAAGGLLFDRAAAGWEVVVFVDAETGYRPLEVLGVSIVKSFDLVTRDVAIPSADMVVASAVLHDDLRVRRFVVEASRCSGDVAVWGGSWARPPHELPNILEYALSAAARAYKYQALLAANDGEPRQPAATESFHRVRTTSAHSRRGGLTFAAAAAQHVGPAVAPVDSQYRRVVRMQERDHESG